jgi:hypothetical protein
VARNPFSSDPFDFNAMFKPRRYSFSSPKENPYTLLQLIEQRELARKGKGGGSFLDKVKHGGGDILTGMLSTISRPGWAIAEGTRRSLEGEGFDLGDFFKGASRGIQGKAPTGFGEVLAQESNWFDEHRGKAGLLGFGLDVVTDPLNLLLVAAAPPTGGLSLLGLAGKEGLEAGARKGLLKAAQKVQKESFSTFDEADETINLLKEGGDDFQSLVALAETKKQLLQTETLAKGPWSGGLEDISRDDLLARIGSESAVASKEFESILGPKMLQARLKIPFSRAGTEFAELENRVGRLNRGAINLTPAAGIRAPSLARVAEGASKLNKIPFAGGAIGQGADLLGKAFKPGFKEPGVHAAESVAKRNAEFLHRRYRRYNDELLRPFMKGGPRQLDEEKQLDALEWGEGNAELVDDARKLNTRLLRQAVKDKILSGDQANFIRAWHRATEHLRKQDENFHIEYDKPGEVKGLYVPHIYSKQGSTIDAPTHAKVANVLSKKGHQYARKGSTTIKGLRELAESDELRQAIETDPITLLAARTRRGAQAHADRVFAETIAKAYGKPSRVADEERLATLAEKRKLLEEGETRVDKRGRSYRVKGAADLSLVDDAEYRRALDSEVDGVIANRNAALAARVEKRDSRVAALKKERDSVQRSLRTRESLASKKWPTSVTQLLKLSEKELKAKIDDPVALKAARKAKKLLMSASVHRSRVAQVAAMRRSLEKIKPSGSAQRVHGSVYRAELIKAVKKLQPDAILTRTTITTGKGKNKTEFISWLRPLSHKESWKDRLDGFLDGEFEMASEKLKQARWEAEHVWDTARKAQKGLPRKKAFPKRRLQSLDERIAKEEQLLADDTAKIHAEYDAKIEKATDKVEAKRVTQMEQSVKLSEKLDRNARQSERALSSLKNPEVPADWATLDKLLMPSPTSRGKKVPISVTPEIKAIMTRQRRVVTDDAAVAQFDTAWHKMVSRWKLGATVVNPGYAVRNTLSDAWNMYLSGVPAWAMVKYGNKTVAMSRTAERAMNKAGKDMTKEEAQVLRIYAEAYYHGIMSGLYEGDIQEIARFMKSGKGNWKELAKSGHPLASWTRAMSEFNRHRENWGRFAHYVYRREHEGLSPAMAAAEVKAAHFDYEDLTAFEQKIKRNVIPFYTWTRKNIPFQIKQLGSRPGRFAAFPKGMNEAEFAAGEDGEGGVVPDYLREAMAFRVPGGDNRYMIPGIGAADLKLLQHPENVMGMMNPFLKMPAELVTGRSFSTGAPIAGGTHPRNPISTDLGGLLRMIPGSNFGQTERTVRGQQVAGLGASPYLSYAFGQVPFTNYFFNQKASIREAQRGSAGPFALGDLAYLGGFSMADVDGDQAATVEMLKFKNYMQKQIRGMRDEDFLDESTDKDSDYEQQLLNQIKSKMGRPRG